MRKREILLIVSLVSIFGMLITPTLAEPTVYLDPSENSFDINEVSVGYRFNVTAMVSNVTGLFGFQVALYYNASVLNMTQALVPADHVLAGQSGLPVGPTYLKVDWWGVGFIGFTCLAGATAFSGSGKLAVFEFEIIASPPEGGNLTSGLIVSYKPSGGAYATILFNSAAQPIESTGTDGSYIIIPEFLSFLILSIFLILTMVTLVLAKKLRQKREFKYKG